MQHRGPIALFDSGEGGLTVLRHLWRQYPGEHFLYAADSLHFPYGPKPLNTVRTWFLAFLDFFFGRRRSGDRHCLQYRHRGCVR